MARLRLSGNILGEYLLQKYVRFFPDRSFSLARLASKFNLLSLSFRFAEETLELTTDFHRHRNVEYMSRRV